MKLSIQVHGLHTIDDWVALAKRADEIGLADIHIAERIDFPYPTWPTLFMMAQQTQHIRLGTGVTNPYSRHPALTAKMVALLDNYSQGRAVLGIGQGDLWNFGQMGIFPEHPLQGLREGVQIIQHLLAGNEAAFKGEVFSVPENFKFSFRPYGEHIPIFIGTRSPGGMALAGEIADELHVPLSILPEIITIAQQKLREGMQKAGRDGDLISLAISPQLGLSQNRESAIQYVQQEIGYFVRWTEYACQLMGVEQEEVDRLADAFLSGDNEYLYKNVSQRYLDAFSIAGSPHEVIEQIERLADLGVEHITFNEPGPNLDETMTLLEKEVLPHFAS